MLYCILGDSGSGKDTVVSKVLARDVRIHPVVQYTTRPRRPGEKNGREYFFVNLESEKDLKQYNPVEIRKYTVAGGDIWYYFTAEDSLKNISKEDYIMPCSPSQFSSIYNKYKGDVFPIILTVPDIDRLIRLVTRDKTQNVKELCRRFSEDKDSMSMYIKNINTKLYCIENDDLEVTLDRVMHLISNNRNRSYKHPMIHTFHKILTLGEDALRSGYGFRGLTNIKSEVQIL